MTRAEAAYERIEELKKTGIDIGDFEYISKYALEPGNEEMTRQRHSLEMGLCHKLLLVLPKRGAGKDEIIRVVKYYIVALDSMKYRLDWRKAKADFGIDELLKKYF